MVRLAWRLDFSAPLLVLACPILPLHFDDNKRLPFLSTDLSPVAGARHLVRLSARDNHIDNADLPNILNLRVRAHTHTLQEDHRPDLLSRSSSSPFRPFALHQSLDLAHNFISSMARVSQHRWLRKLDLSHNQIAHIEGLEACAALEELSLSHNRVRRIQGLGSLHMLRRLDLV